MVVVVILVLVALALFLVLVVVVVVVLVLVALAFFLVLVVVVVLVLVLLALFLVLVVVVVVVVVVVLLALFLVVVVLVLVPVCPVPVVAVEILDEWDAVNPVVVLGLYAEVHLFAVKTEAAAAIGNPGAGVVDGALVGGRVVTGAQSPALSPEQPVARPHLEAGVDSAQGVAGARRAGDEAAHSFVGVMMHLVVTADGVDGASHGASTVEQRGRTLDDLQPLDQRRVDQFPVVAGLGGQGAGPDPVLHDQDAVAVEAADDGPRRTRAETAFGDPATHFVVQQFADGDIRRLGHLVWPQRLHALECLEDCLVLLACRHRDFVSPGQQLQEDVRFRRLASLDDHHGGDFGEQAVQMDDQAVSPGRNAVELVVSIVVGDGATVQLLDGHAGVVQRLAGVLQRNGSTQ